ncbi:MAG: WecB/TagA/CpsF family glycosyltransferase [bacterium]|nr:WecB/TagA/CpsF family glycosyltransferase [bacterium]
MKKIKIFGVNINQISSNDALAFITDYLALSNNQPLSITTPNPEILVAIRKKPELKTYLNSAELALPDGQGVVWASKGEISERVTGTDMMMKLLSHANSNHLSVGFVVNPEGLSSNEDISNVMKKNFSNCKISFINDPVTSSESYPDIIFIGLGFPQQEQWVFEKQQIIKQKCVLMTVGGGIDFLTNKQVRAPLFIRQIGLEWLWRLIKQPKRFKRIFTAIIVFPILFTFDNFFRNK